MTSLPILYSFRRCPYAMRARMALWISGTTCELREVKLADKPDAMLAASSKGTVPVVVLPNGEVIDESIDVMRWALSQSDPEGWLAGDDRELLEQIDGPFKHHLDRYKYWTRHDTDPGEHRAAALEILRGLDTRLAQHGQLSGPTRTLADIASFPFVRQFANHDRAWFDALDLPHLQRWLAGHLDSELFAAIMAKHSPWKPGDEVVLFQAA
ncbi:glutathione S-transferase [Altererythrobacter arenosus]|uniref:Glutathione S-transferase n=1 Tax=Altererythrobacter arenosus TaxID=3032592 RepID=A0ABY8FRR2_9SPHN|nr:glutathione S-transferase [Altererythrobacter sp. CAU 1644]WFL76593.1 glutathione S-transferase [Altererythrobacter sp. CAU 1644]